MKPTIAVVLVLLCALVIACSQPKSALPSPTPTESSGPILQPTAPATAPAPTAPSTPAISVTGVATDILNVRSGPGLNYAVVTQLKQGDSVTITGKSADGLWWQISGGWVSATYIQVNADASTVPVATPQAAATP